MITMSINIVSMIIIYLIGVLCSVFFGLIVSGFDVDKDELTTLLMLSIIMSWTYALLSIYVGIDEFIFNRIKYENKKMNIYFWLSVIYTFSFVKKEKYLEFKYSIIRDSFYGKYMLHDNVRKRIRRFKKFRNKEYLYLYELERRYIERYK